MSVIFIKVVPRDVSLILYYELFMDSAIPNFKNDDILFIYGAMACYKKRGNLAPNARRWTAFF